MKELKIEGKTVSEAVEKAMAELQLNREQIEVEILDEGKKGVFGIGGKSAVVIVREKKWSSENPKDSPKMGESIGAEEKPKTHKFELKNYEMKFSPTGDDLKDAENLLSQIFSFSGISFKPGQSKFDQQTKTLYISFYTEDSGLFLYDDAKGLFSLQYLINSIINKGRTEKITVRLDTGDFWARTEERLARDIEKAISTVKRSGRPYRLRPMPSQFRKIIHDLVKEKYPDFQTVSEGEDKWRKVVIKQNRQ
ncbi:MAG: protein jag [Elusimicrobiota bacterium]